MSEAVTNAIREALSPALQGKFMNETTVVKAEPDPVKPEPVKAAPKADLPPAVATERARCRRVVTECVAEMKATLRGSATCNMQGALERMILIRFEEGT